MHQQALVQSLYCSRQWPRRFFNLLIIVPSIVAGDGGETMELDDFGEISNGFFMCPLVEHGCSIWQPSASPALGQTSDLRQAGREKEQPQVQWFAKMSLAIEMANMATTGFRCGGCSNPCHSGLGL